MGSERWRLDRTLLQTKAVFEKGFPDSQEDPGIGITVFQAGKTR